MEQYEHCTTDLIRHFTDDVVERYEHSVLLTLYFTDDVMERYEHYVLLTLLDTLQMMSWSGMNTMYY